MFMLAAVPVTGAAQSNAVSSQKSIIQTTDSVVHDSITGTAHITFPINNATVQSGYENNAVELGRISKDLKSIMSDSTLTLHNLTIHGFGSIDGPYRLNEKMAHQRTDSVAAFVSSLSNLSGDFIATRSTAEDWVGFKQFVERCSTDQLPHKEEILSIINGTREPDAKEWLIKSTYPEDYRYLIDNCMPQLRRSDYTIKYIKTSHIGVSRNVLIPETTTASAFVADTTTTQPEAKKKRLIGYLRTNLLLPLLNIGFEVPIGNRWSVAADWYYPWAFRSSSHKNCYQIDGLALEGRYWFGSKHTKGEENKQYRLLGHAVSVFAMGGRYDLEHNYKGHQGEYILGGVDYMYAKTAFKGKMHLEFYFGLGYLYTRAKRYEVYEREGKGYYNKDFRKKVTYFGPIRAGISLVLPIKM